MSVSKKAIKNNNYKLKGSLRKCGFDFWRYYFNGVNAASGEERVFFIELMTQNPGVCQDSVVLYKGPSTHIESSDLQAALSGNIEIESAGAKNVVPSFCCIRAGVFGNRPRQLVRFLPNAEFSYSKRQFSIKAGGCVFTDNEIFGVQTVTKSDCMNFPEYSSDDGRMEWNLKYERSFSAETTSGKETCSWLPGGLTARYSGTVLFDGVEYLVTPEHSFGYCDKIWGQKMPAPFLHVSSGRLTSIFTGSVMKNSAFALEGDFNGKVTLFAKFENEVFAFGNDQKIKKYESKWSCAQNPSVDGGEDAGELHWSVSISSKKYILDVDVFCPASTMVVKEHQQPVGASSILKILCCGSGKGEIRVYRQIKKSLELIQHAKILNALSEYGVLDD